jgi:hypothetical protein
MARTIPAAGTSSTSPSDPSGTPRAWEAPSDPSRWSYSSVGMGSVRGCPWMTAADRCLGHVGGTSGEDGVARNLLATVASWIGGRGRSSVTSCFVGKRPEDVRQCKR